jgi:hypothetical protein
LQKNLKKAVWMVFLRIITGCMPYDTNTLLKKSYDHDCVDYVVTHDHYWYVY